MKLFGKYFSFLLKTTVKKKSIWWIGLLYLFLICLYLYITPSIAKTSCFLFWTNPVVSIQSVISYISCIFSSLLILAIYKEHRDNGTELLIVSKPISRNKIQIAKALTYFVYGIVLSFLALFCGFFIYCFDVPGYQQSGLIGSLFLITFIVQLIFGAITLLVSIYLNKIWVIMFGVLLCVFSNIYYVIIKYADVVKTPTDGYLGNGDTQIATFDYLNDDGTYSQYSNIVNQNTVKEIAVDLSNAIIESITSRSAPQPYTKPFDDEKADYDNKVKNSHYKIANYFNFTSQMSQMGNGFGLKSEILNIGNKSFGSNRDLNYDIDEDFLKNAFSKQKGYPIIFYDYDKIPYISKENASNIQSLFTYMSDAKTMASLISMPFITLGTHNYQANSFTGLAQALLSSSSSYCFQITYPDSRQEVQLSVKDLKITDDEKSFFNTLLWNADEIQFKNNNGDTYSLPSGLLKASDEPFVNYDSVKGTFINNSKSINLNSSVFKPTRISGSKDVVFSKIQDYTHFALLSSIKTNSDDWKSLNIKSIDDFLIETLKFKYFIISDAYGQIQNNYINEQLKEHAKTMVPADDKYMGALITPVHNVDASAFSATPNEYFYNKTYIGISTLVKNLSLATDNLGYVSTDPTNFNVRNQGNLANLLYNQDTILTASYLGFTFHSSTQLSTEGLYFWWIFAGIALYIISFAIYRRIDFK